MVFHLQRTYPKNYRISGVATGSIKAQLRRLVKKPFSKSSVQKDGNPILKHRSQNCAKHRSRSHIGCKTQLGNFTEAHNDHSGRRKKADSFQ